MLEIELSILGNTSPTLLKLLDIFQKENGVAVRIQNIPWNRGWSELLTFALTDRGPDVSHVGSTWVSSLVGMQSLRPFSDEEVKDFGGPSAFLPQCWQSVKLLNSPEVYAAPWTAYTFVLCYRTDLLAKAGISQEKAFTSAAALNETLNGLKAAGIHTPWVVSVDASNLDTLHQVASWIWGEGGEIIGDDYKLLCTQPAGLAGLKAYFGLFKYLSPAASNLNPDQAMLLFQRGDAAVTIVGADLPYLWTHTLSAVPAVLDNLGIAPMPGVPWIGGDHLVIWRHTRVNPQREKAALALVKFLVSQQAQKAYACGEEIFLPTRADAFASLPKPDSQLTTAAVHSLQTGRSYHPLPLWSKIEHRFGVALGYIGQNILSGIDPQEAILTELESLEHRLAVTLGG